MDTTSESIALPGGSLAPDRGRLLFSDGLFYALLPVAGEETPLAIALHGVSSEFEAAQALNALVHRRFATAE